VGLKFNNSMLAAAVHPAPRYPCPSEVAFSLPRPFYRVEIGITLRTNGNTLVIIAGGSPPGGPSPMQSSRQELKPQPVNSPSIQSEIDDLKRRLVVLQRLIRSHAEYHEADESQLDWH
jgi:hypothetical protein